MPSKLLPNRLLADVYPSELFAALAVTEFVDPERLYGRLAAVVAPSERILEGLFHELLFNGPHTVERLCSFANACGLWQFTDTHRGNAPGTYTLVYRLCRARDGAAVIEQEFRKGTRDLINGAKAAICLIDIEKATLPRYIIAEMLHDPVRAGVYALVAYNGGAAWSRRFYEGVNRLFARVSDRIDYLRRHKSITEEPFFYFGKYNRESHEYAKKYMWIVEKFFGGVPSRITDQSMHEWAADL